MAGVGRSTVIVASLGFEERFLLRAVVRRGVRERDKVVVFMPERGDPRGEKAFQTLRELVEKAFPQVEVIKYEVDVQDFYGAVGKIRGILKELALEGDLVFNLSGGQRLLILEILAAALSLGVNAELEVETEDSSGYVAVPLKVMHPLDVDNVDQEILRRAVSGVRLKDLEHLSVSKATLWRKLKRLTEEGLLEMDRDKYKLSDLGRMWI
ncbi:MAG: CRISPR-associated CARF protein Csa3 [Candidatus Jordarchaeales archaeon]